MERQADETAVYWVDQAGDVEIRNGIVCWSVRSGGCIFEMRGTPSVLIESVRRSVAAYSDFIRQSRGTIVPLVQRRKRVVGLKSLGIDE